MHENFNKEKWLVVLPEKPLKESAQKFQQGKVVGVVPEKPLKENA